MKQIKLAVVLLLAGTMVACNNSNSNDIIWQAVLDPITQVSTSGASSSFTLTIESTYHPHTLSPLTGRLVITLHFESPAVLESFQASFNAFQDLLKTEASRPPGIIPAFSRLYYGCGVVFPMVPS